MSNLIRTRLSTLSCLEVGEERYGPPLFAAMATGSKEAVQAFAEALYWEQLTGRRLIRYTPSITKIREAEKALDVTSSSPNEGVYFHI